MNNPPRNTSTTNNIFVTGDMPVRGAHSESQGQVQSHRDGQLRCQVRVCRCDEFTRAVRPPDVQHFGVKPPMPAVCQSLREREKREGVFFATTLKSHGPAYKSCVELVAELIKKGGLSKMACLEQRDAAHNSLKQ